MLTTIYKISHFHQDKLFVRRNWFGMKVYAYRCVVSGWVLTTDAKKGSVVQLNGFNRFKVDYLIHNMGRIYISMSGVNKHEMDKPTNGSTFSVLWHKRQTQEIGLA